MGDIIKGQELRAQLVVNGPKIASEFGNDTILLQYSIDCSVKFDIEEENHMLMTL